MDAEVIIVGAGAAGLMCAKTAAERGRRVILLEHNDRIGKKVLISGGGRCNFTNLHATHEHYISQCRDYCKSALARFRPQNMVALVEGGGIAYHEKKLGQLFCDESSRQITTLLWGECKRLGVEAYLGTRVESVEKKDSFEVKTSRGVLSSESVVIATGGLSFPKLGATDTGYRIAKHFGHEVIDPRPGLVPLTLNREDLLTFEELSGVSVDAVVSCGKRSFRENILFTHRGLSGPAILQISSYWTQGEPVFIDLCPGKNMSEELSERQREKALLVNVLSQYIPRRLAEVWCSKYAESKQMLHVPLKTLREVGGRLNKWELYPSGTEGYEKAEVTIGGVDVRGLSSKSMESKTVPRLYFIGEVVDVTGHLGGFNFQWAWASGYAAGQSV